MSSGALTQAIALAKSGDKAEARRLLESIVQTEPDHEIAWIWMTDVVESDYEKRICLEKVLSINSTNLLAKEGLRRLKVSPPFPLQTTRAVYQNQLAAPSQQIAYPPSPSVCSTQTKVVKQPREGQSGWQQVAGCFVLLLFFGFLGSVITSFSTSTRGATQSSVLPTLAPTPTISPVTFLDIKRKYDNLTDIQRKDYLLNLIGMRVHWEGQVRNVQDDGTFILSMNEAFFDAIYLRGVPSTDAARFSKGQAIEFDAVIGKTGELLGGLDLWLDWQSFGQSD